MTSMPARITAFAPGSIGNLGPGLDILGAALEGPGDEVTVEWSDEPGIVVADPGASELPVDPARHASAIAVRETLRLAEARGVRPPSPGVMLRVRKGLPLAAGQGGSAASAVAAALAMNVLLGRPLDRLALLAGCLVAETTVAGRHLDNLAPSMLGGIVLVRRMDPIDVVSLPIPPRLRAVLAHPAQTLRTEQARAALPSHIDRATALHQAACVAAMVAALYERDLPALGRAIDDRIAEPARAALIPGFREAKAAALGAGAFGASISGAGPTVFALADGDEHGARVAAALQEGFARAGVRCAVRVTDLDRRGARVIEGARIHEAEEVA